MPNKLKALIIGDLEIEIPILQGGMGVMISTAPLASTVANCGGAGIIASVGLGWEEVKKGVPFVKANCEALINEIRQAKELTKKVLGVNIMAALSNYADLVLTSAKEKIDFIVSGAGLPLKLPELIKGASTKLVPIVSSAKAANIIIKTWKKRYNRLPDAIVVEGPLAGGHLGFKPQDLTPPEKNCLEHLVTDVLKVTKEYEINSNVHIPVIAAGGIFDGKDIARFLKLGASGVQIATRFVTTHECSVASEFKEEYLKAQEEDVVIINSPVGMPGRAIRNKFIDRVTSGEKMPIKCTYRCLRTCDPPTTPYCIADALCNAAIGKVDKAVVFCGSNVPRIDRIVSVKELMDNLVSETLKELAGDPSL